MHSRIFEIKKNKKDANNLYESSIECSTLDWYGIDYVAEIDTDYEENDLQWLQNSYQDAIEIDTKERSLRFIDIEKFMQSSFNSFRETLALLNNVTIKEFSKSGIHSKDPNVAKNPLFDISYLMYTLNTAFEDKSGFYIYYEDTVMPIDKFVRENADEILSETFYIGNILDYHF